MSAEHENDRDLVNTTDCLEAVSVFRSWKNLFFVLIVLCLLVLQLCFWTLHVDLLSDKGEESTMVVLEDSNSVRQITPIETDPDAPEIAETARQVTADANIPVDPNAVVAGEKPKLNLREVLEVVHILWTIRTVSFLAILLAIMYCLTILFAFKISLVGRLGGINHIARALVLSGIFLVLILPWQEVLGWFTAGAIYAPGDLIEAIGKYESSKVLGQAFYYVRFTGYQMLVLAVLFFAQLRTRKWSGATLRRLEIV